MQNSLLKNAGIVTLGLTGLLHLAEMSEYYGEERYIGVLFGLSAVGAVLGMVGIVRNRSWGWLLGTVVAAGTLIGYVLSRTIGLPSFREASWSQFLEPMGLASIAVEGVFLVVAALVYSEHQRNDSSDLSSTGYHTA